MNSPFSTLLPFESFEKSVYYPFPPFYKIPCQSCSLPNVQYLKQCLPLITDDLPIFIEWKNQQRRKGMEKCTDTWRKFAGGSAGEDAGEISEGLDWVSIDLHLLFIREGRRALFFLEKSFLDITNLLGCRHSWSLPPIKKKHCVLYFLKNSLCVCVCDPWCGKQEFDGAYPYHRRWSQVHCSLAPAL